MYIFENHFAKHYSEQIEEVVVKVNVRFLNFSAYNTVLRARLLILV